MLKRSLHIATLLLLLTVSARISYGQCPAIKKRAYATRQESYNTLLANVSSASNATDGALYTSSQLSVAIGALDLIQAIQYLEFRDGSSARTIPANTPVTIKLSLPTSLLGVLDNLTIQPFNNLNYDEGTFPLYLDARWKATATGSAHTLANVVNLINGNGEVEITITPSVSYQGVWIKLGSVLGIALSANVHYAYIEEADSTSPVDCNEAIEVLSGVRAAAGLAIADATVNIQNPLNIADNNNATYSSVILGAKLLSIAYLKTIFKSPSVAGEAVEIILGNDGSVLNLGLLNNFKITPYLGTTALTELDNTSNFLKLQLLSSSGSNNIYKLNAVIDQSFDRIEISFGGVADVNLSAVKIYEVRRIIPPPSLQLNSTDIATASAICAGNTATLTVSNPLSCTEYKWYEDAATTVPVSVTSPGTTFTTPVLNSSKTYYVKAIRTNACNNSSEVVPVAINVSALPGIALGTMPEICQGTNTASLSIDELTNSPATYSITWDSDALSAGFTNITSTTIPVNNTININTSAISPGTYNGNIKVKNSNGCESMAKSIQITIDEKPSTPNIHPQNNSLTTL